jgi:hypothetical protein
LPDGHFKSQIKSVINNNLPIIERDLKDAPSNDWKTLIEYTSKKRPYQAVVFSSHFDLQNRYHPDEFSDFIKNPQTDVGFYNLQNKKLTDVLDQLDPFLRINKRLVLINAYQMFFEKPDTRELFKALIIKWQLYGGIEFKVIRSKRTDVGFEKEKFENEFSKIESFLRQSKFKGKFLFIAVDDSRNRIHERYLLGSYCGLQLGYGLELGPKPQTWQLLNESSFRHHKKTYFDQDIRDLYPEHTTMLFS